MSETATGWVEFKGDISPEEVDRFRQQHLDGEALWKLREAARGYMVEVYGPHRDHGRFLVQVVPYSWDDVSDLPGTMRQASAEGSTIAEAADKAREALR